MNIWHFRGIGLAGLLLFSAGIYAGNWLTPLGIALMVVCGLGISSLEEVKKKNKNH